MVSTNRTAAWAVGGLLLSASVSAQERGFDGAYALGHLKYDITSARVSVDTETETSTSTELDFGARVGYRQTLADSRVVLGVEGGFDTGNTLEGRTVTLGEKAANFSFEKRGTTLALDGVVGFKMNEGLLLFGTLGYATSGFSRGAFVLDVGQPPPPEIVRNDRLHALTWGGGFEARFAHRWRFRIAATRETSQTFGAEDFGLSPEDFDARSATIVHSATQVKFGLVLQF